MQHLPPPSPTSTSVISTLADLVAIAGGLFAIGVAVWQFRLYRQLHENEIAIKDKQAEIDAVPEQQLGKAHNSSQPIAQPTLNRMIEAAQAPLKHDMRLLERDRKFILNKLLFAKK